jgi:hypothetical protein
MTPAELLQIARLEAEVKRLTMAIAAVLAGMETAAKIGLASMREQK